MLYGRPVTPLPARFNDLLVCPRCRGELVQESPGWTCRACPATYGFEEGTPNFIVGERFPDADKSVLLAYEERANRACAEQYYVPVIAGLTAGRDRGKVRVVSVGCGSGVDVEVLTEAGFDAIGFDCGYRNEAWPRRHHCADRFLLANGLHAPFENESFDVALTGCVFPHVGVVGDSYTVAPTYRADRLQLAREMTRIVRPGGHLLLASPNRSFPFDLFHRHDYQRRIPRPTRRDDPFLLSLADYAELFREGAGCRVVEAVPTRGYWGFVNMGATWPTWLLRAVLRTWFGLVDARGLRASVVAPWMCVHVTR